MPTDVASLLKAPLSRILHALAAGEASARDLVEAALVGVEAGPANAWAHLDADAARSAADRSDARRARGEALGRLDGVPVAVMDCFDVEGMPTGLGLPASGAMPAAEDAAAVGRLRGAGTVVLGKTAMDEAGFGTLGVNPHGGAVDNPALPDRVSGGAGSGAAAAVAAGQVPFALAADTLGSARIPAAFCGVVGLRPTWGEASRVGMAAAMRRLDVPALVGRHAGDLILPLQLISGYDARDVASRARRVPFAPPDWDPTALRVGRVADLRSLGASPDAVEAFGRALEAAGPTLGHARPVSLDLAALEVAACRRAALLLMEADLLAAHGARLDAVSAPLAALLGFARSRSAVDAMAAEQRLDALVVAVRELFERFDLLVLPTVPAAPPVRGEPEPPNLADFTALASLAGCPALSLPLPEGHGLQLVGPRGSDLRLLEVGGIVQSVVEASLGE